MTLTQLTLAGGYWAESDSTCSILFSGCHALNGTPTVRPVSTIICRGMREYSPSTPRLITTSTETAFCGQASSFLHLLESAALCIRGGNLFLAYKEFRFDTFDHRRIAILVRQAPATVIPATNIRMGTRQSPFGKIGRNAGADCHRDNSCQRKMVQKNRHCTGLAPLLVSTDSVERQAKNMPFFNSLFLFIINLLLWRECQF